MLSQILDIAGVVWSYTWWAILPIVAFVIFNDVRDWYKHHKKMVGSDWVLLQIVPPRELEKTPKAMEQVLAALAAIEKGRISLELEGAAGRSYFYIRTPKEFRNLVESAIYAQYPEVEISIIEPHASYLEELPYDLPNDSYDIYGEELVLAKDNPYPILTHPHFEEREEERRLDPIANIVETMSALESDEHMWIQFIISPVDEKKWEKESEKLIDKIQGNKKEKSKGLAIFPFSLGEVLRAPFEPPGGGESKDGDKKDSKNDLTPGKRDVLKAVEEKISRPAYETTIRFLYIDSRERFSRNNVVSIKGAFRQFNSPRTNQLVPDKETLPAVKRGLFKKARTHLRKRMLYDRYKSAYMRRKPAVFNNEELATMYHFPISGVITPALRRTTARRGGPPTNLPIADE